MGVRTAKIIYTLIFTVIYAHKVKNPLEGIFALLSLGHPKEGDPFSLSLPIIAGGTGAILFGQSRPNTVWVLWGGLFSG